MSGNLSTQKKKKNTYKLLILIRPNNWSEVNSNVPSTNYQSDISTSYVIQYTMIQFTLFIRLRKQIMTSATPATYQGRLVYLRHSRVLQPR